MKHGADNGGAGVKEKKHNSRKWILLLPVVGYVFIMLVWHALGFRMEHDDAALIVDTLKPTVWQEIASIPHNFYEWSSRVLVNLPIHVMLHFHPLVWGTLEMGVLFALAYLLCKIFAGSTGLPAEVVGGSETGDVGTRGVLIRRVFICASLFLFPFDYMIRAGWITTTMTYMWPMTAGLYACYVLVKLQRRGNQTTNGIENKTVLEKTKTHDEQTEEEIENKNTLEIVNKNNSVSPQKQPAPTPIEAVTAILATIYAANLEQISVLLTVVFAAFLLVRVVTQRGTEEGEQKISLGQVLRKSWLHIVLLVIAGCSVLFHAFVPGNAVRSDTVIHVNFADYGTLSLVDKLEIGFSATMYELFFRFCPVMLWLAVVLAVRVWKNYRNVFCLAFPVFFGALQLVAGAVCGGIMKSPVFGDEIGRRGVIDERNYMEPQGYLLLVLLLFAFICVVMSVLLAYGKTRYTIYALAVLFGGLLARMALAFSPAIWVSGARTFGVMYMALIIVGLVACLNILPEEHMVQIN